MSTILIAYEREMEQNAVEKLLAERGHTVIRSSNGVDALELARRESPSLIISDISLPKMDGFSLCKKWKQDEHLQAVPFMFYTRRHDDPKYERFALELGVDRFVERTSDPKPFYEAVDAMLADGAVARKADTMRLQALTTGAFLTTGKHMSTQSQLATTIVAPAKKNGNGATTATPEERALAREARLLSRIAELDAQNKQLQTGEQRLRESLDTQMRAAAHIADTYAAIQVAAADGFLVIDENDRIRDANEAYCRLSGYGKDELLKFKITDIDLRWRDDASTHTEVLRKEGQLRYQSQHKRKDGSLIDVELSVGSLTGAQSRRVAIIRDITARTRRNEIARRTERTKDAALEIFAGSESADEAAIMRRTVESAASLTESPLAYLCWVDASKGVASLAAMFEAGKPAVIVSGEQRTLPAGPWLECARGGKPQVIEEMSRIDAGSVLPLQHRALFVPVTAGTTCLVVCAANRGSAYAETDATMLAPLVSACGLILRVKHSHVQTLMASQRAEVALHGVIDAMSRMVERHDPHGAGMAQRVAALASALARELGLAQREQDAIRTAALLHRVGYTAIPPMLLSKPELSPTERALVRTHVDESRNILAGIEFGAPVVEIVYQHQERLDGSGFPRGLRGDQIMMEARILGAAEALVAMLAKEATLESALASLKSAGDKLFDKRVVEACVRLFKQQGFALPA